MSRPHGPWNTARRAGGAAVGATRRYWFLVLLLLSVERVLALQAWAETPWVWVAETLPPGDGTTWTEPTLVLEDTQGRALDVSRDCRLLEQGSERRLCGRIPAEMGSARVLKARLRRADGSTVEFVLNPVLQARSGAFDVVLVLDASTSMRENDPQELRARAVREFVAMARDSRGIQSLALVAFRSTATVLLPPTPPAAIGDVTALLRRIRPSGSTEFDAPLEKAVALLQTGSAPHRAVLFLSDGQPSHEYNRTHAKLARLNCPVYTIGLSDQADATLLTLIAEQTGGSYFQARTADQLRPHFSTVFRMIERPRSVLRQVLAVDGTLALPFCIDETMHNPILSMAVSGGGRLVTTLDGAPLGGEPLTDIAIYPLHGATRGAHELQLSGRGRTSCEITADTTLALETVPLNETAPRQVPILLAAFLRGAEQLAEVQVTCEVRDPAGRLLPVVAARTDYGLYTFTCDGLPAAGTYHVQVDARGTLPGGPVLRRAGLIFTRAGSGTATPLERQPAMAARTAVRDLPVPKAVLGVATNPLAAAREGKLGAIFWSSAAEIRFPLLYPGTVAGADVEVQLTTADTAALSCALDAPVRPELPLRLEGTPTANRKSTLRIVAAPSTHSAGQTLDGALVVRCGGDTWRIPFSLAVAVPRIRAELGALAQTVADGGKVDVRGSLSVQTEPAGHCAVECTSDVPGLCIDPAELEAGPLPQSLGLAMSLAAPPAARSLHGTIRLSGPGLAPVEVPIAFVAAPPASGKAAATASTGFASTRLALLLVGLVLLLLLLLAAARGNRRAVFVLASLLFHALVLLLVLPERSPRAVDRSPVAAVALGGAGAEVIEDRIVPESAPAEPQQNAEPDAAVPEKANAERRADDDTTAKPLVTEAPPSLEPAPAAATPAITPAQRQTLTPDAIAPTPAALAERKRADAQQQPEGALTAPAEKTRLAAAEGPASVAQELAATPVDLRPGVTAAGADMRSAVERETMSTGAVTETLTAPARRRDVAPAGAAGDGMPASASPSARVGTVMSVSLGEVSDVALETAGAGGQVVVAPPARTADMTAAAVQRPALAAAEVVVPAAPAGDPKRRVATKPGAGSEARAVVASSSPLAHGLAGSGQAGAAAASRVGVADAGSLAVSAGIPSVVPVAPSTAVARAPLRLAQVAAAATGPTPPTRVRVPTNAVAMDGEPRALRPAAAGKAALQLLATTESSRPVVATAAFPVDLAQPAVAVARGARAATTARPRLAAALSDLAAAPVAKPAVGGHHGAAPATREANAMPPRNTVSVLPQPTIASLSSLAVRPIEVGQPKVSASASMAATGSKPPLPGGATEMGFGRGRWRNTFPNLRHSGDWDCDRTAMLNLAHQFEQRTGSTMPFDSRTVSLGEGDLGQAPFLFMSGHTDLIFSEPEVRNLREYLNHGGYLWINDSTDIGDETYDRAVRREIGRVLAGAEWRRIPADHPLFRGPYDLTHGFRGYVVPPGDKYRQDYLEGVWIKERLAVIYTRNDYGDGLEIDVRTHPLMASLTDLSPEDMEEGSVRMGINIASYCIARGDDARGRLAAAAERGGATGTPALLGQRRETPLPLLGAVAAWQSPRDWGAHVLDTRANPVTPAAGVKVDGLTLEFAAAAAGQPFKAWATQAVLGRACALTVGRNRFLLLDMDSALAGGGRVAVGFKNSQDYLESAPVFFRPGLHRDVVLDLGRSNFKSAASKWEYRAVFPETFAAEQVYLIIFPQQPAGRVVVTNLRLSTP